MQLKQRWGIGLLVCVIGLLLNSIPARGQTRSMPVRVAYSALSAGIGVLWLTHAQGIFSEARPRFEPCPIHRSRVWRLCEIVLWTRHRSSSKWI
jgi:hypothetical protein